MMLQTPASRTAEINAFVKTAATVLRQTDLGGGLSVESFPQKYFLFFFPSKTCLLPTSIRNDQVSAQNRLNGNITTIFILISIENLVEANRDLRK